MSTGFVESGKQESRKGMSMVAEIESTPRGEASPYYEAFMLAAALRICWRVRKGAALMSEAQFVDVLLRTVGVDKFTAKGRLSKFRCNPAGYLASRVEPKEAEELLRVIFTLTGEGSLRKAGTQEGEALG